VEKTVIEKELKHAFNFFWHEANKDRQSKGYGLILDRTNNKELSSIASVGFALSVYIIGIERDYITAEEGMKRIKGTLHTLLNNVPHYKGFFVHFANMIDGSRYKKSEFSTIDTAIVLNGLITVESYFEQDSDIQSMSKAIRNRVDWEHFTFDYQGKKMFRMAYNPDLDGDYAPGKDGWIYQWHMPAEQLMMYFLAAGSKNVDETLARSLYFGFERFTGGYQDYQFVYTPGGSLFTYQFSHAWFDFESYVDSKGFDWFENSKKATLANREWCINHQAQFKTLHQNAWGLTACDHPYGYAAFGTPPFGWDKSSQTINCNGTIAPYGPISSIIFTPKESFDAMQYFYNEHPKLWGKYGFKDAYNLEEKTPWYSEDYIGIDKGITCLMLDNYLYKTTQNYYMKHDAIQKAIKVLGFKNRVK